MAANQGKTAALNMLGRDVEHTVVPYFFSDLADWASIEYVGPALHWDEEVVRGNLEIGSFSVWYLEESRLRGVLAVDAAADLERGRQLIAARASLTAPEIAAA